MELAADTVICPSCGQQSPADAKFCAGCGKDMAGLPYAGFWIRFVAYIIDAIILLVINAVVGVIVVAGTLEGTVIAIAVGLAYTIGFWTARGATPGKMAVGTQITTVDGEPIDFGRALLRYIGYWVSGITLGIGFLMIAFTGQKRGLHDYIAGTVVIKTR